MGTHATEKIVIHLDPPPEFDPYTRGQRLFMVKPPAFMNTPEFAAKTKAFIDKLKECQ